MNNDSPAGPFTSIVGVILNIYSFLGDVCKTSDSTGRILSYRAICSLAHPHSHTNSHVGHFISSSSALRLTPSLFPFS